MKLTTFIGRPIPYNESHTPESLAKVVVEKMQLMIENHQPRPGNIIRAIRERFTIQSKS